MGRSRSFEEADVVAAAAHAFRARGYEGTGVDALVRATGLHRGSLYKAFGSKRGLFLAVLRDALARDRLGDDELDIALVAALELSSRDAEVRELLRRRLRTEPTPETLLGQRLLDRAGLTDTTSSATDDKEHTR